MTSYDILFSLNEVFCLCIYDKGFSRAEIIYKHAFYQLVH